MSTKALKLIFLLTEALLMTSFVSGTELKYNRDAQCSGKVTVKVNSFICDSDESQGYYNQGNQYEQENMRYQSKRCQAGDDVTATGTVTFKRDMPQTVCIQRRTCFMGLACVSEEKEEGFDVCSELNLEPIEKTYGNYEQAQYACPERGTYTFSTTGEIPDSDGADLVSGGWIKTYVTITDCSEDTYYESSVTKCQASFSAISEETRYYYSSAAAVGVLAFGLIFARKRRAVRAASEPMLDVKENDGNFETMQENGVRA